MEGALREEGEPGERAGREDRCLVRGDRLSPEDGERVARGASTGSPEDTGVGVHEVRGKGLRQAQAAQRILRSLPIHRGRGGN